MSLLGRLARMGIKPALDPNAHQPVFYSALNEAIRTHPMKEAAPEQWLGTIKNLPGVKSEEVKWSGIEDYLNEEALARKAEGSNRGPSIPRDEIYEYLEGASERYAPDEFYMTSRGDYANKEEWLNDYRIQDRLSEYQSNNIRDHWFYSHDEDLIPRINVEPVGPRPASEVGADLAKLKAELEQALNATNVPWGGQRAPQIASLIPKLEADYQQALARESRDPLTPDMFTGQREIDIEPEPVGYRARIKGGYGDVDETLDELFPDKDAAREAADDWIKNWRHEDGFYAYEEDALSNGDFYDDAVEALMESDPPEFGTAFNDYALKGGKDYEELLLTLPNLDGERAGTHWDEYVDDPVIAHVRYDTRTKDGKKILAVQEVQSDWHQQGRESGYEGQFPQEQIDAAREKAGALQLQYSQVQRARRDVVANLPEVTLAKIADRIGFEPDEAVQVIQYLRTGEMPNPEPLDIWARQRLRTRADQLAEYVTESPSYWGNIVEDAPDAIKSLQTLKQESERLKLSAQEAEIAARTMQGGTPDAPFKNNIWAAMAMKRMARKAAEEGYDELAWSGKIKNGSVRDNQQGSKFYDNVLVNEMNKLGKKAGVEVGSTFMNGFDWNSIAMTPEFKEFLKKGLPLFMWPLFAGGAASTGLLGRGGPKKDQA